MLARRATLPLIAALIGVLLLGCRAKDPPPRRAPPPSPREDVVEIIHGREVHDPYRWLEDGHAPEVHAWVEAQDQHARAILSASRHRPGFARDLGRIFDRETLIGPVYQRGQRYFYARHHRGHDKAIYYVREGLDGRERVLIDPATLAPDGSLGVRRIHPSPDGALVVYAVSRNAADAATLHVRDVDTGTDLPDDVIPGARFAWPEWTPDSRGFYYTGLPDDPTIPESKLPGHASVRHHLIGSRPHTDELLYGPSGDAGTYLYARLTGDGRYLLLHRSYGAAGKSDLYLRELDGPALFVPLSVGTGASNRALGYRDRVYLLTSEGAPRGRVFEIDPRHPQRERWREVVPERAQTLVGFALMHGHLIASYLDEVNARVEVVRLVDGRRFVVELPDQGAVSGIWTDPAQDEALIGFGSLARAPVIYRVPIPSDARASVTPELFWAPSERETGLVMGQHYARSADGTRVPVFVVHRADLELDGERPTILYGYGGFGVTVTPGYSAVAELWAQRGGVWAQASLRGGGEYGEDWHRAGTGVHKQRVFDDFIAAAELLVDAGLTRPAQLGIMGGSNGGLLVGAVSTQRPELFGAVVCRVPLLDMVRYPMFGLGELWIDEYGSPDDPAEFRALHDYSPYHHVRPGPRYPPLLMMSADTDDRVDPLHARKYVAAMQHVSDDARPMLLRTEAQAGHGGADSRPQQLDALADMLSFMLDELAPGYGRG